MERTQELFHTLHHLIEQHENRGIIAALNASGQLPHTLGDAAASLIASKGGHVAIVTGFFIPEGDKPRPETDGPVGAAQLAHFLELGGWDVELITDGYCGAATTRCRELAGGSYPIQILSEISAIEDLRSSWISNPAAPTHVIAIERAGPAASGKITNIAGDDITEFTPPLHRLFEREGGYHPTTISLADGTNEIGADNIKDALIAASFDVDFARLCAIEVDHLVLGCTANTCATAFAAAIAIEEPSLNPYLASCFDIELNKNMLNRLAAEQVALDGVLRKFSGNTVDGFDRRLLDRITREVIDTALTRSVGHSVE